MTSARSLLTGLMLTYSLTVVATSTLAGHVWTAVYPFGAGLASLAGLTRWCERGIT